MKVLKVIHGFPPDYMAGSEVYSYHFTKNLASKGADVFVFTRVENEFDHSYKVYNEVFEGLHVRRINKPKRDYLFSDKYYDEKIDLLYEAYLQEVAPDIVHIGHLSHLSTNIIGITKKYNIPIVFTIHDFWMFCVKGQLIDKAGKICTGPEVHKCCNCSPYVTNLEETSKALSHMRKAIDMIDVFVSPSMTLKNFFIAQGVPESKIQYLKYGFDTTKIGSHPKAFKQDSKIRFGFMGRITPTKGIQVLVETFKTIKGAELHVYGSIGIQKRFLETDTIQFKGPYNNNDISQVVNTIDVLIVPSIWYENAPLVIQEAFLAGIPVIASNIGGMKELVDEGVDGFLFEVGSSEDLKNVVCRIIENPTLLNSLKTARHKVVDINDDVLAIMEIYKEILS